MPKKPARTINADAPALITDIPKGIPANVAAVWKQVVPEASKAGLFKNADYEAVLAYCYQCVLVRRLDEEVQTAPFTIVTKQGVIANPLIKLQKEQKALLLSQQRALGLCPAGRKNLKPETGPRGGASDAAKFFGD